MYDVLYQYLIQHKQVSLPGIGTFLLNRKTAQADFANKLFLPPSYSFVLDRNKDTPKKKLFIWLSAVLNISEWDAIKKVNDFSFELKNQVNAGNDIKWKGIGVFRKGLAGDIKFESEQLVFEQPVPGEKIIRENAEHTMMVGEWERTSTEMTELLAQPGKETKRSYWLTGAIIIGILIIFLVLYFFEHGLKTSSLGTQKKIPIQAASSTYKQMQ
ncbi:MAG: hypothetical protein M3O67_03705 [Bacteroidota bacterium]|nr:hypothetical protein [Bacteroidota bacterium]